MEDLPGLHGLEPIGLAGFWKARLGDNNIEAVVAGCAGKHQYIAGAPPCVVNGCRKRRVQFRHCLDPAQDADLGMTVSD